MAQTMDLERFGLIQTVVNEDNYERSIKRFQEENILLPTFAELVTLLKSQTQ